MLRKFYSNKTLIQYMHFNTKLRCGQILTLSVNSESRHVLTRPNIHSWLVKNIPVDDDIHSMYFGCCCTQ